MKAELSEEISLCSLKWIVVIDKIIARWLGSIRPALVAGDTTGFKELVSFSNITYNRKLILHHSRITQETFFIQSTIEQPRITKYW